MRPRRTAKQIDSYATVEVAVYDLLRACRPHALHDRVELRTVERSQIRIARDGVGFLFCRLRAGELRATRVVSFVR